MITIRQTVVGTCRYRISLQRELLLFHEVEIDDSPWYFAKLTFNAIRDIFDLELTNEEIINAIKSLDIEEFSLLCTFIRAHDTPVPEWKKGIHSQLKTGFW